MNQEPLSNDQISEKKAISTTEIIRYLKLSCLMPDILVGLINQKIIEQTASKEGIFIEEQELQTAADKFRFENNLITSHATIKWLEKYRLSVTEFEELVKSNLLEQKLAKHLFESQVESYFSAHRLEYNQAIIYEIIFTDFNLAMELFYGIQEEEVNFWELAHQYINDDELRRLGGYKGPKNRAQLEPEISAAVFNINENNFPQIIKPIAIGKQIHLILVEEILQPVLDQALRDKILSQLFEDWLSQNRQQYNDFLQL